VISRSESFMQSPKKLGNPHAPLVCPTRARLAQEWRIAARRLSGEVTRAEQNLKHASLQEYERVAALSAEVRRQTEQAMQEFRSHVALHGCGPSTPRVRPS
jgi:hypothetical protein